MQANTPAIYNNYLQIHSCYNPRRNKSLSKENAREIHGYSCRIVTRGDQ